MSKPKKYLVFRLTDGLWRSAEGIVLADFLAERGIVLDDRVTFARLSDYERYEEIWYRAYGALKITITIWAIDKG